ncbi:hypothetical protein AVEN_126849-1 [Araneus ventricosus]|uniref:Uncharacterized protein n=1 Tax=Araneus ventricosus TaxID=182803 RepID=A0A4Y2WBZ9_ARAVE|nr:hypothetical protein AVEN_126849-1 [Araneus ventricosus]
MTNSTLAYILQEVAASRLKISRFKTLFLRRSSLFVGVVHVKSDVESQMSCRWCGTEASRGVTACPPFHLIAVQNNEVYTKITRLDALKLEVNVTKLSMWRLDQCCNKFLKYCF